MKYTPEEDQNIYAQQAAAQAAAQYRQGMPMQQLPTPDVPITRN